MNVTTKPGLTVEFSVQTYSTVRKWEWYFQEETISNEEADYRGSTTEKLIIEKCLPKHKGAYKCVVTDESGETFTSKTATLSIGTIKLQSVVTLLAPRIVVYKYIIWPIKAMNF